MDVIELIMHIEDENDININIDDTKLIGVTSIDDLLKIVDDDVLEILSTR